MLHKKIHAHAKKHAKRAHTHIQNHGHKWIWLLSLVFFIVLVYPYFSNADEPTTTSSAGDIEIETETETETITATIEYDPMKPTDPEETVTWEVVATVTGFSTTGVTITNNSGDNTYTFTEDGLFVFEFENDDGATGSATATVDRITHTDLDDWLNDLATAWSNNITWTITYSPWSWSTTTWPVIATLSGFSTTGVTITNNSGNNTYTFTETWSFTFEFTNEDGATGSATATVGWIVPPVIPPVLPPQNCEISITSPLSGDIVWWSFPIQRESNEHCDDDSISIQLRDHNEQRIDIGTWFLYDEEFVFASTGLASTGFYTTTGLHLSGSVRETVDGSGAVVDSGVYEEPTPYIMYTGTYTGEYTDFATGYTRRLIRVETETILTELEGTFTIDNQAPEILERDQSLSGHYLTGGTTGEMTYTLWSESILTFDITGSEELTWFALQISGSSRDVEIIEESDSYNYILSIVMKENKNLTWDIEYILQYQDIANNQASKTWTRDSYTIDTVKPNINNLSIQRHEGSWSQDGSIGMDWETDKATVFDIAYGEWEEEYILEQTESYDTEHSASLTWIEINVEYWFTINIYDQLQNHKIIEWIVSIDEAWELTVDLIQESDDILQMSEEVETSLYLQILQNEVNKFRACKDNLAYNQQTIDVWNNEMTLLLPVMSKTRVNTAMTAFILLFTNKIETRTELSQAALHEIANVVNNFLVVLKLTDDDDNACEQKVSNYYMGQFGQMMEQMNFF